MDFETGKFTAKIRFLSPAACMHLPPIYATPGSNYLNISFHLINPAFELDRLLKFETGQTVLNDPALWFGQTCGYPLMTSLRDTLTPISVPVFDIHGCDHTSYSSLLIVPVDSKITTLQECQGLRAVINNS